MRAREAVAGAWLAGLRAWRRISDVRPPAGAFRIMLMHDVAPDQYDRLAALLDFIAARGGFLTPAEALRRLSGGPPATDGHVPWLVTFDDGFASNRAVADSLLAPRGIRAVFFVCPGLVDLDAAAQRKAVTERVLDGGPPPGPAPDGRTLMGWDDLITLARDGHAIGAHSLTHQRLTAIRDSALEAEIAGAGARIADRLGVACDWFAYPFGDIDSIDAVALAVIGRHYRVCRSGVRGFNRPGDNRLALTADHVDLSATARWQHLVLAGGLDGRYRTARRLLAAMAAEADYSAER